jgi:hypothetical protein
MLTYEAFHRGGAPVRLSFVHRCCQHGGIHMLRFALSVVALAGVLATVQPAFADPLPATASDHAQAAAAAVMEQPAPPAPASSRPSETPAPAGFGWG